VETTTSVQDYLKAIYSISTGGEEVTTSAIAARLHVRPASATAMIKRLAAAGYLKYLRYQGVQLTEAGHHAALEVIRHHRLLESYLHEFLGMDWDLVHDEAEVLEHALSEQLEDRIAEALGNPTHDPHGDPIPPKSGRYKEVPHTSLDEFASGRAKVERVSDRDPAALRYLRRLGVVPGVSINVEEKEPFGGPVWVQVGRKRHAIGRDLATTVFVSRDKT
jgi:DtxR family Mn-dependent transcriptional regulator